MISFQAQGLHHSLLRTLKRSTQRKASSLTKLTTGSSIPKSSFNPATKAIADRIYTKRLSRKAAQGNIRSGIDSLKTADSGLMRIQAQLESMTQLAQAAASELLDAVSRDALNNEFASKAAQINTIARSNNLNNNELLSVHHIDIGFVLDSSGSMGGEIANLSSSVSGFRQRFIDAGLDVQFGLVDVNVSRDSGDSTWRRLDIAAPNFDAELAAMAGSVTGGAVDPYSALLNASGALDTPGTREPDTLTWRGGGTENHLIYITDTRREADKLAGSETQADVAAMLAASGVIVHVIAPDQHHNVFDEIVRQTGGHLFSKGNNSGSGIPIALDVIAEEFEEVFHEENLDLQVGVNGTSDDTFDMGLPLDSTLVALDLVEGSINTPEDARAMIDAIKTARDGVSEGQALIGANIRRLVWMDEHHETMSTSEAKTYAQMHDVDIASEMTQIAKQEILTRMSLDALGQLKRMEKNTIDLLLQGIKT